MTSEREDSGPPRKRGGRDEQKQAPVDSPGSEELPRIEGEVVDGHTGEPRPGLFVRAYSVHHHEVGLHFGEGTAGPDGAFTIEVHGQGEAREIVKELIEEQHGIVLRVYVEDPEDPIHISEERSGDERLEPWRLAILDFEADARRLNETLAAELERVLKEPETLRLISRMLAKEGGMDPEEVYEALVDSDPFGIDPFTFRTTVCCVINRIMDVFKQTSLGQQLILGGSTYKHLGSIANIFGVPRLTGYILGEHSKGSLTDDGILGRADDQDFNFNILPTNLTYPGMVFGVANLGRIPSSEITDLFETTTDGQNKFFWRVHCEITPCDQVGAMRRFMGQIRGLARTADTLRQNNQPWSPVEVSVAGKVTFDGTHKSYPAHLEIHPVEDAFVLPQQPPSLTPLLPQP